MGVNEEGRFLDGTLQFMAVMAVNVGFGPEGGFWLSWVYGMAQEGLTLKTEEGCLSARHHRRTE